MIHLRLYHKVVVEALVSFDRKRVHKNVTRSINVFLS